MTSRMFSRSGPLADLFPNFYILAATVLVTLLAYIPLWTDILLTNHMIPNVFLYGYPSFKTQYEGRWFADIVIQIFGGSGVQSLQTVLAVIIKGINAQILCAIFGERRPWVLFLTGVILSLHPAFLDYYAFTVDAITFEFGDTLILLGVFVLVRGGQSPVVAFASCVGCFVLAIAAYQPKIALCAALLLLWLASGGQVMRLDRDQTVSGDASKPLLSLIAALFVMISALLVYYVSIKLTIVQHEGGARQNINGLGVIIQQALSSYPVLAAEFSSRVDYIPRKIWFLPALILVGGFAVALLKSYRAGYGAFFVSVISVLAIPMALQSSYIINDQTWVDVGRVLAPRAYVLVVCLIFLLQQPRAVRAVAVGTSSILAFLFFTSASQEANAASMKSIFEQEKINRIVARIEDAVPDLYSRKHSIVVIGELKSDSFRQMKRLANTVYRSQFGTETFISYRQAELLNFYIGRKMVARPTADQRGSALRAAAGRRPWPAPDSVFLQDNVIIVVLDHYADGTPVTWIEGQITED